MKQSQLDFIAKVIAASIYDGGVRFIYYLNGYRIIGHIIRYNSLDVTAQSTVIHIEKILDNDMKSLQIKFSDETKIGMSNGIKTIYIKGAPSCEQQHDINGTVLEHESLFDFMVDHPRPNTIDYTEYNDVPCFRYLDCTVHVHTDTTGDIRVACIEIDEKSYTVCEAANIDYTCTQLTSNILYVKMVPKCGLKKYENLFIWIENQRIIKKMQTVDRAQRVIDKIKTGLKRCDEIRVQLKEQIAKLENQLSDLEKNITSEKNTMTIYSDLIKLTN